MQRAARGVIKGRVAESVWLVQERLEEVRSKVGGEIPKWQRMQAQARHELGELIGRAAENETGMADAARGAECERATEDERRPNQGFRTQ